MPADVAHQTLTTRLEVVLKRAAALLPGDAGKRLLAMLTPAALATMAGVTAIWAGLHFFGVGEIADVILLIVGWAAVGSSALEAGKRLVSFALKAKDARSDADLTAAAQDLAAAIGILGIDVVLALLLHEKPKGTFKPSYRPEAPLPPYGAAFPKALPRNGGLSYTPKITFTKTRFAGEGGTNALGDITIGRDFIPEAKSSAEAIAEVRKTIRHEQVHQFIAAKLYVLREPRMYLRMSAYKRSYILRYLEEAAGETVAQFRTEGVGRGQLMEGLRFPLGNKYQITIGKMGAEAAAILLGPVTVTGLVYHAIYGLDR